jgi:ribonuclease Z
MAMERPFFWEFDAVPLPIFSLQRASQRNNRKEIDCKGSLPMECVLLGSGGMMPMPHRLLTSLAVRLSGQVYVFDAGEAVQLGLKKARLGIRGLDVVAVSHLHADHCLGLPGLMMLRAQLNDPDPLTILGPPGIARFVSQVQESLCFHCDYPVHIREWSEERGEVAYQDQQVRIYWQPLKHRCLCLGYRLEELERPGRFSPDRARALKVPRGPLWGMLQKGEWVHLDSGEKICPEQVLGPPRCGRSVAYVVDTRPCKGIYQLCRDANLAFVEGMFLPEHSEHADAKGHLTVLDAARISRRAGAGRAILVHISPRYGEADLPLLETAARENFAQAEMGRDLGIYVVSLPED